MKELLKKGIVECLGTFTLVFVACGVAALTGTSVNPARSLATVFNAAIFNGSTDALAQVWIFLLAPLAGGAIAAIVFKLLHKDIKEVE